MKLSRDFYLYGHPVYKSISKPRAHSSESRRCDEVRLAEKQNQQIRPKVKRKYLCSLKRTTPNHFYPFYFGIYHIMARWQGFLRAEILQPQNLWQSICISICAYTIGQNTCFKIIKIV